MRFMKLVRSPIILALVTRVISLAIGAALENGANFGVNPVLTTTGLFSPVTIGKMVPAARTRRPPPGP